MTGQEAASLRQLLNDRNSTLIRDCSVLESSLTVAVIPALLEPYREKLLRLCRGVTAGARRNIARLQLNATSILEEILSDTEQGIYVLRLLDETLATPVVRSRAEDVLCLKILTWVHGAHADTRHLPAAFADGGVGVKPMMGTAPIYYFPYREQQGLLYQVLHFHEFGHGLYVLHKQEMDDLVKELQEGIAQELAPRSGRNDPHAATLTDKQQSVVNRWYSWAQEFFCDAVGLIIGGPAYLYAFSEYTNGLSQSDFYLEDDDIGLSKHPVTWLRVRLLVRRARELGLHEAADAVASEWELLASAMQITEDYHGYYENSMADDVYRIIGDMLVEADPRPFTAEEAVPSREALPTDTPVFVLNRAWQVHRSDPDNYTDWENAFTALYVREP